jgi:HD superfamily phosphohydrolase
MAALCHDVGHLPFSHARPAAQRVTKITNLKPHIAEDDAIRAVREVDEIIADSRDVMSECRNA